MLLAQWAPEVLVVVAYGLILPPALLTLPRLGCINIHASLLPRWRGAAPIQRAILAGDEQTGVTHHADRGRPGHRCHPGAAARADRRRRQLAAAARPAVAARAPMLLLATLAAGRRPASCAPSRSPTRGSPTPPRSTRREARIDWWRSALEIDRQVRAFNSLAGGRDPVAAASSCACGRRAGRGYPRGRRAPGLCAAGNILGLAHEQLLVQCGQGRIGLLKLQLAGPAHHQRARVRQRSRPWPGRASGD